MFMDQLFGTFFYPQTRRPPVDIGIRDPMPATLLQQILYPFRARTAAPLEAPEQT